ncbi:MAG: histone deacetylase [Sandaracinus sp.]|nr:histone deacetylase [Sandaracinus sp.]
MSSLALVDDGLFDAHESQDGPHPENPARLAAARAGLEACRLERRPLAPRDATTEELARVHAESHLAKLGALEGEETWVDADTFVSPKSVAAARRAAGGALALTDALLDGEADYGLALLRPPGHHARRDRMHGFCLLNNVAAAAAHALARGKERVLVLDWDVHHGDGTEDIFRRDPRVCFVSLHQAGIFPGTGDATVRGDADGRGFNVNVPLPPRSGDADYAAAFARVVLPVVRAFDPELVLVSAGFDAHARDPLASMELSDRGFAAMASGLLGALADRGRGKVGLVLEGGYDPSALTGSVGAVLDVLAGDDVTIEGDARSIARGAVEHVAKIQRDVWRDVG